MKKYLVSDGSIHIFVGTYESYLQRFPMSKLASSFVALSRTAPTGSHLTEICWRISRRTLNTTCSGRSIMERLTPKRWT